MTEALAAALEITGAPMGNAQLLDPATGTLRIVAQRGFDRPFLTFFETVNDRDTACGTAAQDRRLIGVVSAHDHQPTTWPVGQRRMLDSLIRFGSG